MAHADFIASEPEFAYDFSRVKPHRLQGEPSLFDRLRMLFFVAMRSHFTDEFDVDTAKFAADSGLRLDLLDEAIHGDDIGDLRDDKAELTRCAQSAYAVTTYFCGADIGRLSYSPYHRIEGVDFLASILSSAKSFGGGVAGVAPAAQLVVMVDILDDQDPSFGHVFAFHVLPTGDVSWYQSAILSFTLREHIKRTPPLDANKLAGLLANLRALEGRVPVGGASRPFGAREDDAYFALLHERLSIENRGKRKTSMGNVVVSTFAACIVPSWSVALGRAEPDDASRRAEQLLVPAITRRVANATRAARAAGASERDAVIAELTVSRSLLPMLS